MESDSWTLFAASVAKRHQHSQQSRHDVYLRFEEIDGGDEDASNVEYACPFCAEDFDIVELCCHIDDEHPIEAQNGVCPICSVSVGMDMVGHMTMQHGNFFKIERRRIFRRGSSGSRSTFSLLRKELREGHFQALLEGSYSIPPPASVPDPFLSSLIYSVPAADSTRDSHPEPLDDGNLINKSSDEKMAESSSAVEPPLSEKDQEERAQRREFVQGLVLSTIFEDNL